MAVYRVNKSRGYTVMANYHLRDKTLSLKAVGLLSKMLSFNDGWQFSTKGLSAICKEGPDAVLAALRELEDAGYLVRHQSRDEKGRMSSMVFEIYEKPQTGLPDTEKPHTEKPDTDNPFTGKPCTENPAQLNTNQVINNQRNNSLRNYQSINLDGMDRMDEREQYRELIRDNLEIDIRSQDRHYDLDRVNEIVEIMLDAVCSTRPTIRINGEDMLASRAIENIFENSDFVYLLNQASGDRQILSKALNISPSQQNYITNSNAGEGLIFYGSTIVPFKDDFPKDTMLYRYMTTKPEETLQN